MNMGGSSSCVMDSSNNNNNNGSSNGSYCGGYLGNSLGMVSNSTPGEGVEELAMVKVDYDNLPAGSYAAWSGESSVQGSNPNVFTMWND